MPPFAAADYTELRIARMLRLVQEARDGVRRGVLSASAPPARAWALVDPDMVLRIDEDVSSTSRQSPVRMRTVIGKPRPKPLRSRKMP